jgi:hypothetical protein
MTTIGPNDIVLDESPIDFKNLPRTFLEIDKQNKEYAEKQNTYIKPKYECDELNKSKYENPIEEKIRQSYCELKIRCLGPLNKIKNIIIILIIILIILFIGLIIWNAFLTKELQKNTDTINVLVNKLSSTSAQVN